MMGGRQSCSNDLAMVTCNVMKFDATLNGIDSTCTTLGTRPSPQTAPRSRALLGAWVGPPPSCPQHGLHTAPKRKGLIEISGG